MAPKLKVPGNMSQPCATLVQSPPRRVDPRTWKILREPLEKSFDNAKKEFSTNLKEIREENVRSSQKSSETTKNNWATPIEKVLDAESQRLFSSILEIQRQLFEIETMPLSGVAARSIVSDVASPTLRHLRRLVLDEPWKITTSDLSSLRGDTDIWSTPQILHILLIFAQERETREIARTLVGGDNVAEAAVGVVEDFNWTDHGFALMEAMGMLEAAEAIDEKMKALEGLLERGSERRRIWRETLEKMGLESDEETEDGDDDDDDNEENRASSLDQSGANGKLKEIIRIECGYYATLLHCLRCVSAMIR